MTNTSKRLLVGSTWIISLVLVALVSFNSGRRRAQGPAADEAVSSSAKDIVNDFGIQPTSVYAHNLLLHQGPHFRVYIRWIRGQMLRTIRDRNPSFDNPDSFVLEIQKGVMSVQLQDIQDFLNRGTGAQAPLKNISVESAGSLLRFRGTVHKIFSIPVQLDGIVSPMPDGRVQFHLVKLSMLKIPLKGLFGALHLGLSDLVSDPKAPGIQIAGNDVRFNTEVLLPAPHIHGRLTNIEVSGKDVKVIYGAAGDDEARLAQWHNFLQLSGGDLNFGKLTMHQVDLTMIDATQDPWFDLDLVNYQAQLVNGYTRITPRAGLEIYMPDLGHLPVQKDTQGVTLEWLKNRNSANPPGVPR